MSPILYFCKIDRYWSLLFLVRVSAREEEQQGRPQPLHPGSQISVSSFVGFFLRLEKVQRLKLSFDEDMELKGAQIFRVKIY